MDLMYKALRVVVLNGYLDLPLRIISKQKQVRFIKNDKYIKRTNHWYSSKYCLDYFRTLALCFRNINFIRQFISIRGDFIFVVEKKHQQNKQLINLALNTCNDAILLIIKPTYQIIFKLNKSKQFIFDNYDFIKPYDLIKFKYWNILHMYIQIRESTQNILIFNNLNCKCLLCNNYTYLSKEEYIPYPIKYDYFSTNNYWYIYKYEVEINEERYFYKKENLRNNKNKKNNDYKKYSKNARKSRKIQKKYKIRF